MNFKYSPKDLCERSSDGRGSKGIKKIIRIMAVYLPHSGYGCNFVRRHWWILTDSRWTLGQTIYLDHSWGFQSHSWSRRSWTNRDRTLYPILYGYRQWTNSNRRCRYMDMAIWIKFTEDWLYIAFKIITIVWYHCELWSGFGLRPSERFYIIRDYSIDKALDTSPDII